MHLIAPDILAEARELSPAIPGCALVVGWLLWACGWRWHRFWVVVGITVAGGLVGLHSGRVSGGHILATGLLLAVASGLLALELARLLAFVAAGMSVWLAAGFVFPSGQELWIAFLIGGLAGVLLYQLWTMLATSFAGVLLSSHALLCLLDSYLKMDVVALATAKAAVLNGAVMVLTVLGLLAQSWLERRHQRQRKRKKQQAEEQIRNDERAKVMAEHPAPAPAKPPKKRGFWDIFGHRPKPTPHH